MFVIKSQQSLDCRDLPVFGGDSSETLCTRVGKQLSLDRCFTKKIITGGNRTISP